MLSTLTRPFLGAAYVLGDDGQPLWTEACPVAAASPAAAARMVARRVLALLGDAGDAAVYVSTALPVHQAQTFRIRWAAGRAQLLAGDTPLGGPITLVAAEQAGGRALPAAGRRAAPPMPDPAPRAEEASAEARGWWWGEDAHHAGAADADLDSVDAGRAGAAASTPAPVAIPAPTLPATRGIRRPTSEPVWIGGSPLAPAMPATPAMPSMPTTGLPAAAEATASADAVQQLALMLASSNPAGFGWTPNAYHAEAVRLHAFLRDGTSMDRSMLPFAVLAACGLSSRAEAWVERRAAFERVADALRAAGYGVSDVDDPSDPAVPARAALALVG